MGRGEAARYRLSVNGDAAQPRIIGYSLSVIWFVAADL